MFLPADLVHGLARVLHDVEAIVDDLVRRTGLVFDLGLKVWFHLSMAVHPRRPWPVTSPREIPKSILFKSNFCQKISKSFINKFPIHVVIRSIFY